MQKQEFFNNFSTASISGLMVGYIQSTYPPFGSPLIGRTYKAESLHGYRFGFNGKEKDDETYGDGNEMDFGARIYDSRLGRWMSVDPLQSQYQDLSPYNFVGNMPLSAIDPDGKTIKIKGKENQAKAQEYFAAVGLSGAFRFNIFGNLKVNRLWALRHRGILKNPDVKKIHDGVKELSKGKYTEVKVHFFNTELWSFKRTETEEGRSTAGHNQTKQTEHNGDIVYKWDNSSGISRVEYTFEGKNSQYVSGVLGSDIVINEGQKVDYLNTKGDIAKSSNVAVFFHLLLDRGLGDQKPAIVPHPSTDDVSYENSARNKLGLDNRSGTDLGKETDAKKTKK